MTRSRFGSLTVGARALVRQIAATPGAAVTIFVAILLAALFVSAVPRVLERVSTDDLRESLARAEPELRNVWAETHGRIGAGPDADPFSHVRLRGDRLLDQGFPDTVRSNIASTQYLVDSPQFRVSSFPDNVEGPFPTFFRFRYQEGVEEEVSLVAGDLPEPRQPIPMLVGGQCPADPLAVEGFEEVPEVNCRISDIPVFEAALTSETAEEMMVGVGDRLFMTPDAQDSLWPPGSVVNQEGYVLVISGIIELSALSDESWFADAALHRPRIRENLDFRFVYGTGLMAADRYQQMATVFEPAEFHYTWRYFVDPELVHPGEVETLRADLSRILPLSDEEVSTLLPSLLTSYLEQRTLTVQLMSTAVTGLAIAAVGVVLVLAVLIAERQAWTTVLIRDRGASRGQLTLTSIYHGMLLVAPAAVLGYLVTAIAVAGTESLASGRASAALAAGATAAVVVASGPYIHSRLGSLRRLGARPETASGRRSVIEVFVLAAAAASIALLRRRGLADPVAGEEAGFDALLAVAPAVIGVAVGIVAIRLLAPLMRTLSWLTARGRALSAFIGFRRLVALPAAGRAPSLVILLAVALAVFSWVVRSSIDRGQEEHAWQIVGADFRIDGYRPGSPATPLPQDFDPGSLASGMTWAEAAVLPDTSAWGLERQADVTVLAIDFAAYREVLAGSDTGVLLPSVEDYSGVGPVPVIVSTQWRGGPAPTTGTEFRLEMGNTDPSVVAAGVADRFPGMPYGEPFVVVDLGALREALGGREVRATTVYLDGPASQGSRLEADVTGFDTFLRVTSRHEVLQALAGDPFSLWVHRGLAVVFYLGIVFAVVAAISLLTVTAASRRRDLGLLRILGLKSTQATIITTLEQAPPILLATLAGATTGAMVSVMLAPALDLESFTGNLLPGEIVIDPMSLAAVVAVMVAVLGLTVASFVVATRAEDYGRLLRVGDE